LCAWRDLPGKDETLLRQAVEAAGFKISKKTPLQSYIHQLPARYVDLYAKADPIATLRLYEDLNPILDQEGTRAAYRLDVDLLPMVLEMRHRGIRVDQSAAEPARDDCLQKRDATLAELSEKLGSPVSMAEIASPIWKARTFDAHAINYPRTEKGNPSFKAGKAWVDDRPSPLVAAFDCNRQQVRTRRKYISRRPHPGAPDRRSGLCRNQSPPLGRRRNPFVPVLVFKSTAATNAVAR
jgi:hypothetical protein